MTPLKKLCKLCPAFFCIMPTVTKEFYRYSVIQNAREESVLSFRYVTCINGRLEKAVFCLNVAWGTTPGSLPQSTTGVFRRMGRLYAAI